MVRIKMLVSRSGADGAFAPGDELEVPTDEARRMVAAEQCEIVRGRKPESAVKRGKFERANK